MASPIKPRSQANFPSLENHQKEDKAADQTDVGSQDAARPISSPASVGLVTALQPLHSGRSQSEDNGANGRIRSSSVKNLKSMFESRAQQSPARNGIVCQIPLSLVSENGGETTVRDLTPRLKRNNSADRIRIAPSIQALGVGVEAVIKARADKVKTDLKEVEVATVVVTLNPLFRNNDTRLVTDRAVLAGISYLLSEMDRAIFFFDCEKAAGELSVCILRYPGRRKFLIDTLIQLQETLEDSKRTARFNKVLILLLEKGGNESFLARFFTHPKVDPGQFAAQAASRLSEHKELFPNVVKILSRIIHHESRFQKRETLFRQFGLSSSLFRELGAIYCSAELNTLKKSIANALMEADPSLLCLDYHMVREALKSDQEQLIQERLAKNAERFIPFASHLLSQIYAMKISPAFSQLLAMRRRQIISFLKEHPSKENEDPVILSRSYICEVICLRFLIPQIGSIEAPNKHLLNPLIKMVQCLANEIEKSDQLTPLYNDFIHQHCQFIDRISLPSEH